MSVEFLRLFIIDVLKCKRYQIRRLLTRALNYFKKNENDLSLDERISNLKLVEEKAKSKIEIEESYREKLIKIDNDETVINNEFDEFECYIDKWKMVECKLVSLLAEKENSLVVNETVTHNATICYSKLKLPTFDGNIKNS
ncbi:uncharacterized protein NPIL_155521 [Nephila pilipes]|uniref:Uncharacterized protein n=1 Tax=Nephila pilipes TaxID=299642 RepID=A0A8X6QCD0_NEPPI|nr:uncharacterized protein NPIL_155521 [Nephila pilipes]